MKKLFYIFIGIIILIGLFKAMYFFGSKNINPNDNVDEINDLSNEESELHAKVMEVLKRSAKEVDDDSEDLFKGTVLSIPVSKSITFTSTSYNVVLLIEAGNNDEFCKKDNRKRLIKIRNRMGENISNITDQIDTIEFKCIYKIL